MLLLTILIFPVVTMATIPNPNTNTCHPITIPMCRNIGYNQTQMPNPFNHDSQEEAGLEVHQYWPLVEIKCSPDLKFFICSLYVPICMEDYRGSVGVCREVCLRAREGCEPVMTHYGFSWPDRFACNNFPPFGPESICMDERRGAGAATPTTMTTPPKIVETTPPCSCTCKKPLIPHPHRNVYNMIANCSLPCRLYPGQGRFSDYWLGFWSLCCFVISAVTMVTFWMEVGRFPYPERPIVYLSCCYLFISLGYLVRIYYGHEAVACETYNNKLVVKETNFIYNSCSLVFFLVYYFGMAGGCWWVCLCISWYLAAGCKWGTEAIAQKYPLFHLVAWVTPLTFTLTAAATAIDGDPVAGICSLGNGSEGNLFWFVIWPGVGLLVGGTVFLVAGFVGLVGIRRAISKQAGKTDKLEKLMIRIGVFSILYTFPVSVTLATNYYEVVARREWVVGGFCSCHGDGGGGGSVSGGGGEKPLFSVLMIKYFLTLAVGIATTTIWIWSRKTLETWGRFFSCHSNVKADDV